MRPEKLGDRRVILSVSGGKDSAATSLYLRELGVEHERVFMDTGWEHPSTYEYLRGELTRVLGPITEIRGERTMVDLIRFKRMFPSRVRRFCTQELKVFPLRDYIRRMQDAGAEIVNAVGIRAGESEARSKMGEWDESEGFDCDVWRPLIAWSEEDVIAIHRRHGLKPNPLYLSGASRVGCWPCIFARKEEIRLLSMIDPDRIDLIRTLEAELSERAGAPRAWFHAAEKMGRGNGGPWPIDEAVAWSTTSRGGRQFEMFAADPSDAGCMRWGLCDIASREEARAAVTRKRSDEES